MLVDVVEAFANANADTVLLPTFHTIVNMDNALSGVPICNRSGSSRLYTDVRESMQLTIKLRLSV